MYKVNLRTNKQKRILRVRKKVFGETARPRVAVFRSNKYIYAQIIDDVKGNTLIDISTETKKLHEKKKKMDAAREAGKLLAKKALEKNIKTVVFDRRSYNYHGRVKELAEGAREGGLIL